MERASADGTPVPHPPPLGRPPPPPQAPPPLPPLPPPPPPPPPPRSQGPFSFRLQTNQPFSSETKTYRECDSAPPGAVKKTDILESPKEEISGEIRSTPEGIKKDASSKAKMSFGVSKVAGESGILGKRPGCAITMKLKSEPAAKKTKTEVPASKPSGLVAKVFGSDSEDEEEMPPEARLRMRNLGKNTPTSAGPNSFNKSGRGFSDPRGIWNKSNT